MKSFPLRCFLVHYPSVDVLNPDEVLGAPLARLHVEVQVLDVDLLEAGRVQDPTAPHVRGVVVGEVGRRKGLENESIGL